MKLYHSEEDLQQTVKAETLSVARQNGFDTTQEAEHGHTLCGNHGAEEIIDVYPDGTWEIKKHEIVGDGYTALRIYFKLGAEEYSKAWKEAA